MTQAGLANQHATVARPNQEALRLRKHGFEVLHRLHQTVFISTGVQIFLVALVGTEGQGHDLVRITGKPLGQIGQIGLLPGPRSRARKREYVELKPRRGQGIQTQAVHTQTAADQPQRQRGQGFVGAQLHHSGALLRAQSEYIFFALID